MSEVNEQENSVIHSFVERHIRSDDSVLQQAKQVAAYMSKQLDDVLEIDDDFESLYLVRNGESIWVELFFNNGVVMVEALRMIDEKYPDFSFVIQSGSRPNSDVLIIRKD